MIWQDIIIAAMGFLFSIMLIPQLLDSLAGRHVNATSSGMTTLGLVVMGACFLTLDLWLSALSTFVNGAMWLVLFVLGLGEVKDLEEEKKGREKEEKERP